MGCGTCVKVIVFITNTLFALLSLALIGLGVVALLRVHGDGPVVIIVMGAIAFVISFLGCCGAAMNNKYMLFAYAIMLVILMNLKSALAAAIMMGHDVIGKSLKAVLQHQHDTRQSIADFETTLSCCGPYGPHSYSTFQALPASCCVDQPCAMATAHKTGCFDAIDEFVKDFAFGIAGCCMMLVILEFIAVIFGLCLANHVSNKYKSRY